MSIISNFQSFHASASGTLLSGLSDIFKQQMDTVLLGGRDITLHLPPAKSVCTGGCKFNSTYKRYMGANQALCQSCKGDGFIKETRQTIYRANIRWTDEPLGASNTTGEDTVAGRVYSSLIRTKTVIESYDHILQADSATIDGIPCILWNDPRLTGWDGNLYYVISFWQKANKKVGRG